MGERQLCKLEVVGSIPIGSTNAIRGSGAADGWVSWVPAEAAGGPGGRREPAPRSDDRQLCKLEVVGSIPIGSTNAAAREKRTAHHFDVYDL